MTPLVTWRALGTTVVVLSSEPPQLPQAAATVHRVLDEIDRACSRFRDDSELCRLNAAGGSPMRVSRLFVRATRCALRAARLTDGDLDPTIGSSIRAAGYDRDFATIRAGGPVRFRRAGGWRCVELDDAHSTVRLPPGVELDYGATAKALAADVAAAAAALDATGGVLVSIGGDIATAGTPPPTAGRSASPRITRHHSTAPDRPSRCAGVVSPPRARRCGAGRAATASSTTSSTRRPARPAAAAGARSASPPRVASTRTSRAPRRSSAASAAPGWLETLGLPARLVAIDGTVSFAAGWPAGEHSPALMPFANVGPSALWYLTRATGAVTLLLLTVSVVLGVATVGRLQTAGWPRFVVEGLHRNVSLLAILVLLVHIVTSVLDPFASIHLIDAVVPFTASYRPLWLGLGAFASDLLIAIALTSVVRRRLGHGAWRATHWLAYLCWPVAVLHTVGTGSDVKQVWLLALTAACIVAVIVAVWARIGFGWPQQRGLRGDRVRRVDRASRNPRRLAPERAARHGLGAARRHACLGAAWRRAARPVRGQRRRRRRAPVGGVLGARERHRQPGPDRRTDWSR